MNEPDGFYQYIFIKLEARRRKLTTQMNFYSREFFSKIFETLFSHKAKLSNFKVSLTIPDLYVFIPSKSNSDKDMLKLKMSQIVLERSDSPSKSTMRNTDSPMGEDMQDHIFISDSSFPFSLSLASCSLGVADSYTSMEANDIEVPKMEKTQHIFRTEKVAVTMKATIKATKKQTAIHRLSNNQEVKIEKVFSMKSVKMTGTLPCLYAELDIRALSVILQIFDLWVVNIPFILHPYLEISQFEQVAELMKDSIFNKFKTGEDLLQKIMSHNLLNYDFQINQILLTCNLAAQGVYNFLMEDIRLASIFGFCNVRHQISCRRLVLFESNAKSTVLKFLPAQPQETSDQRDLEVSIAFNNPYLIGAIRKFTSQNDIDSRWDFPIDICVTAKNRLFLKLDPNKTLNFQKCLLYSYLKGKIENAIELKAQITRGDRLRSLTEQAPAKPQNFSSPESERALFPNNEEFERAKEQQMVRFRLSNLGGVVLNMFYNESPMYLLSTPNLLTEVHLDVNSNIHVKVELMDPKLIDATERGVNHPIIIEPHVSSQMKHPGAPKHSKVKIIFCQLNDQEKAAKKFKNYLGIKGEHVKLVVLKRRIQELVDYFRKHLLHLFLNEREFKVYPQSYYESLSPFSEIFIEAMIHHPVIVLPRSSLITNSLVLSTKRIGVWSTGQWGRCCGELVKTGHFAEEFLVEKLEFHDVLGDEEQRELQDELKNLIDLQNVEMTHQKSSSSAHKTHNLTRPCPDGYKVYVSQVKAAFTNDGYQEVYYSRHYFEKWASIETGKFSVIDVNFDAANLLEKGKPDIPIEGKLG